MVREDTVPGAAPHFQVELRNVSAHRLILELGTTPSYTESVRLFVVEPGFGPPLAMRREPAASPGRLEPLAVTLPAGKVLRLPVILSEYFTPETKDWKLHLQPGIRYAIFAEFRGEGLDPKIAAKLEGEGLHLEPYFVGTVRSPAISFEIAR